jgi:YggT family protein
MFYDNYLSRIINVFMGVVLAILGMRVLFRLFDANATNDFVGWVYRTSGDLMQPFRGIFPTQEVASGYTLDVNALFAMLMYLIVGVLLAALLGMLPLGPSRTVAPATRTKVVRK